MNGEWPKSVAINDREEVKRFVLRLSAFGWLLVVGGTFAVLVAGSIMWSVSRSSRRVETELARIRMAGQPVNAMDLGDYY